jgi:hypothetical protein
LPRLPIELRDKPPQDIDNVRDLMTLWASQGWSVFPLVPNAKEPLTENGVHDATTDPAVIARWAKQWPNCNVGGALNGKLVIDIDPRHGGEIPTDLPATRKHLSGRGDGGCHLVFALSAEQQLAGVKSGQSALGPGIDIKTGAGSYVVLPGSVHPEGARAHYTSDGRPIVIAPDALVARLKKAKPGESSSGQVRSVLSSLLNKPPAGEGERNNWLAKVCGHYAKLYRALPDLYWTHVNLANRMLTPPLDPDELDKTGMSIWNTEVSGNPGRDVLKLLSAENGYLASGDHCLICAGYPDKKGSQPQPYQWSNFDLRLVGILQDPTDGSLTYECLLQLHAAGSEAPMYINAHDFGDPRALRRLLAARSATVKPPEHPVHRTPDWAARLHLYLRSQEAPLTTRANHLGWNEQEYGFLTLDGVIDENGSRPYTTTRPDPRLRESNSVHQHYGFAADLPTAQDVLSRVLTFHDTETVAVFGCWWAANWAKHILRHYCNMFPVMAIEAASGSGKTTGFFSLMVALSGSTIGEGHFTVPTLRNALAANFNGITWVDDLDNPKALHELIRVLTSNGALTKMSANSMDAVTYNLVGSLVLSGESLEIRSEKALLDRCVILEPPNPTGRTSVVPQRAGQSQWLDVMDLRNQLRDLGGGQALAGHFIAAVLKVADQIDVLCANLIRGMPSGRIGERMLALAVGARILDYLVDADLDPIAIEQGRFWSFQIDRYIKAKTAPVDFASADAQDPDRWRDPVIGDDNKLTLRILPAYFSTMNKDYRNKVAFHQDGEIWFNLRELAHWWYERHHGRINSRLESEDALVTQLKALSRSFPGLVRNERARVKVEQDAKVRRFKVLSGDLAKLILLRAEG